VEGLWYGGTQRGVRTSLLFENMGLKVIPYSTATALAQSSKGNKPRSWELGTCAVHASTAVSSSTSLACFYAASVGRRARQAKDEQLKGVAKKMQ